MKATYYKRRHQYWKNKGNGQVLLINTENPRHHYRGDCNIFLNEDQFDQSNRTKITEEEFEQIRKKFAMRILDF